MAKKKSWFDGLKKFFSSDSKSKQEKDRRNRWAFSRVKSKRLPVLPAPTVPTSLSFTAADDEQSKHAVAVAVATAVAAEAAVAAAQAAAEVVRLTANSLHCHRPQEIAAIKIQTAFRGYLARSALKALNGLVKLQAVIRGQAVRRQTMNTFRGLQSLMKIQSQARASRVRALVDCQTHDWKDVAHRKTNKSEVIKGHIQQKTGRKWDHGVLSHDEMIALLNNKREVAIKRERATEYASSYQERRRPNTPASSNFDPEDEDRSWSWLDEWVCSQPLDEDIPEGFSSPCGEFNRSGRTSIRDDDSIYRSPYFPSYMMPTASANARFRYTARLLSPLPSMAKAQKSPRPKSQTAPARCRRSSDHLSVNSECSLLSWDRRDAFR